MPAAEQFGDRTTFLDDGYEGTLAAHVERTLKLANALATELDIGPGDRFAVMATNSHEYLELYHAAFFGAGIITPSTSGSPRTSSS